MTYDVPQLGAPNYLRWVPPEGGTSSEEPAPTALARFSLRKPRSTHSVRLLGGVATSSLSTLRIARHRAEHQEPRAALATRRSPSPSQPPGVRLTPFDRLATASGCLRRLRSPLRGRPTERAAHGRLEPTLPSVATNRKRYRRRSETHLPRDRSVDAVLKPKPRDRVARRTREPGGSCRPASGGARDVVRGKSDARTIRPPGTHRLLERTLTAFHGVQYPTTLTETGSDLRRGYLPRLCCAFRFSQPLDALFRLQPLRPCFVPVTPLGFRLQRVSLPGSELRLSTKPALHVVLE